MQIDSVLKSFIETEALPGTGIEHTKFWADFSVLAEELAPRNRALLSTRYELQGKIDAWNRAHQQKFDSIAYQAFLKSIGYLVPEGDDFEISTANVDIEIATIAGSQLVVPVNNARFALNAVNARWGSLFEPLYGTDALGHAPSGDYDAAHGAKVIAWTVAFLDQTVPLLRSSWGAVNSKSAMF